ncbi:MAG: sugar isomerase [Cyclobacteriaceae bacterium]
MQYLGLTEADLNTSGGLHTAKEIEQQPELWKKIWEKINAKSDRIETFLKEAKDVDKVILTGAGTSSFIGDSLVGSYYRNFHKQTESISTTHLVSHPHDYLSSDQSILMISFARSGNSPESKAAVYLADQLSKSCKHLIITCNEEGDLVKYKSNSDKEVFLLPPESNDKSLAMTSSYSGMLLTGLLLSRIKEIKTLKSQVELAHDYAGVVLNEYLPKLKEIAELPFERAVFLGSGSLFGTATESHLKLQELTDGNVICKHDSFLGFRHGPKAVVDNKTLIVYCLSNNPYVSKYENDLIFAMDNGKKALTKLSISERMDFELPIEHSLAFTKNGGTIDEDFLCLPAILPSQILGFYKSINMGLSPDAPSRSGAISRVVEGVNIYQL